MKEIPTSVALSRLATNIGDASLELPAGPYISVQRPRSIAQKLDFRNREVNQIVLRRDQRRGGPQVGKSHQPCHCMYARFPENVDAQQLLTQFFLRTSEKRRLAGDLAEVFICQGAVVYEVLLMGRDDELAAWDEYSYFALSRYSDFLPSETQGRNRCVPECWTDRDVPYSASRFISQRSS